MTAEPLACLPVPSRTPGLIRGLRPHEGRGRPLQPLAVAVERGVGEFPTIKLKRPCYRSESMWKKTLSGSLFLASVLSLVASSAPAQTDEERAGARALAQEGVEAFNSGKWEQALDLFGRAETLVHALPHLLYIARSHEKLGRLVEAQEAYIKLTREPLSATSPKAFIDAHAEADRELAALEPRIPSVIVLVSGVGAAEAVVKIDDAAIPRALIGVKRPTNPGRHVCSASAPGAETAFVPITLAEGAHETVRIELLSGAPTTEPVPLSTGAVAPVAPPLAQLDRPTDAREPRYRIPMYVSFGAGAVGLIGGTVFLIKRSSAQSDADDAWKSCLNSRDCDQSDAAKIKSDDKDAAQAGTLAMVGYGLGVVGVGAGVAFWLLDRSAEAPSEAAQGDVRLTPWIGVGSIGLNGSF